ncbi:MAG TPA: hypothetical protein VJX23_07225 [Candidatus Binataceae bacterium]|nr:hypothetical protein [Candidatus Binataceae bacterium]
MKVGKFRLAIAAVLGAALLTLGQMARAQTTMLKVYVDPATGQLFTRPGKGRTMLAEVPAQALDTSALEQRIEQKTQVQLDANKQQISQLVQQNAQLEMSNADLERQMAEIKPAWRSYVDDFQSKFRIGALVYGDWRMYTHTTFQPQELESINNPGPQNNLFNSFDITRAYLNFLFFPTDGLTLRVTPDVYRSIGGSTAPAIGNATTYSTNLDGSLNYRLKYAYIDYNKLFNFLQPMKGDSIQAGALPNVFIPWSEDLFGFRYVTLSPWNYYGLSSGLLGIQVGGPLKFGSKNIQYVDYGIGVYDNATYKSYEQTNTKQFMSRISVYPFGAKWRFDGLGLTWFYDYGYGNVAPDYVGVKPFYQAPEAHIMRQALMAHYTAENWGLIFEYDYGHNAYSTSNAFSGSAPSTAAGSPYINFNTMSTAFLNNGRSTQKGFDVMGHYHIPQSPFTVFEDFQWFQPNTKVNVDPLDFQRWIVGIQWQYNEYLRFALDTQNLSYYHDQFNVTEAYANSFAPGVFSKPGAKVITDAVPVDDHSIFLNMEFNY